MSGMRRARANMKRPRWLKPDVRTWSRESWKSHVRQAGNADIGPTAHQAERNKMCKRMKPLSRVSNAALAKIWEMQDYETFFKRYRQGRQAFFIFAGVHLAAQRRPRPLPAPRSTP